MIDLDALERDFGVAKKHPSYADERLIDWEDDVDALIAELRASRKVVEAAESLWNGATDSYAIDRKYWTGVLKADINALHRALAELDAVDIALYQEPKVMAENPELEQLATDHDGPCNDLCERRCDKWVEAHTQRWYDAADNRIHSAIDGIPVRDDD